MYDDVTFDSFDGEYFKPSGDYLSDLEIMQYTGLKDKNGREIYEGDVVRHLPEGHTGIVRWAEEICAFEMDLSHYVSDQEADGVRPENVEVLGNTYENPELCAALTSSSR